MVQPRKGIKEKMERASLLEETKDEIHTPGKEIDEEITEVRKEEIHSLMIQRKKLKKKEKKKVILLQLE